MIWQTNSLELLEREVQAASKVEIIIVKPTTAGDINLQPSNYRSWKL